MEKQDGARNRAFFFGRGCLLIPKCIMIYEKVVHNPRLFMPQKMFNIIIFAATKLLNSSQPFCGAIEINSLSLKSAVLIFLALS